MEYVSFFIPGKPKSAQQLRFNRKTGNTYRTKEYKQRTNEIGFAASKLLIERNLSAPIFSEDDILVLHASFEFPYTGQFFRQIDGNKVLKDNAPFYYNKKVDIDNMLKSLKDGMSNIIYPDDSQICEYGRMLKNYTLTPGIQVTVRRI